MLAHDIIVASHQQSHLTYNSMFQESMNLNTVVSLLLTSCFYVIHPSPSLSQNELSQTHHGLREFMLIFY